MIRKLRLTNWRNYDDVSIELQAGTTFVVASNGVGKTSLVEAARWALFGIAPANSASPIRVGADHATATAELVLPSGRVLTVGRTMTVRARREPASPELHLDGEPIDADAFDGTLREAYGTDPTFLARLTMPAVSRDLDTPTALGLESHLGQYFGVDGLQRAGEHLATELKNAEKQIRQVKVANASTARQLTDLETESTTAAGAARVATRGHAAALAAHEASRTRLQDHQAREAWSARHARWLSETEGLLAEIARELNESVSRIGIEAHLEERLNELSRLAENARIQMAVRDSRAATIRAYQASLDEAHSDCPVCRRPLDDTTIARAHGSNDAELEALAIEIAELKSEETSLAARRRQLQTLAQRWKSVPGPGPEPETPTEPAPDTTLLEDAASQVSSALDRLVNARAQEVDAERRLQEAREADSAMRQLTSLFRTQAKIEVALHTTRATLDELLKQTVRPLASEVDRRWAALFPNRGELSTGADGAITRAVEGHALPFDAFSTGESMVATIVLRLLVVQMATTADFCWFDEPLEHLDPDVRRQIASILSRASDGAGQLHQILVTTYEEPLARHLAARNPDHVHLIDVRQAPDHGQRMHTGTLHD